MVTITELEKQEKQQEESDRAFRMAIRSRANKSLAVLEKAFIRNGSGRYFVLRTRNLGLPSDERLLLKP